MPHLIRGNEIFVLFLVFNSFHKTIHRAILFLFLSNFILFPEKDSSKEGFLGGLSRKGLMRGPKETSGASPERGVSEFKNKSSPGRGD